METLLSFEPHFRLGSFIGALAIIGLWETIKPFRPLSLHRSKRWTRHLSLIAINTLLLRLLVPIVPITVAGWAQANNVGVFHQLNIPLVIQIPLAYFILEMTIFYQHILFHRVFWLWQLHQIHHSDTSFDVTTGLRFHPLEILISLCIKIIIVLLIGAPAVAVLLFEIILNAGSMFSHGNIHLPIKVDHVLRWLLVTPNMHRIHHSIVIEESDSNFGFFLSIFDHLFGTYTAQARYDQQKMAIGMEKYRNEKKLTLAYLLLMPFRN